MEDLAYAIVVTGGIGTGKSTACNLLKLYGYAMIDADKISHNILSNAKDEIIEIFGNGILDVNGVEIDRKKLGKIVFNYKEKMKILENILHPKIRWEIFNEAQTLESHKKPYFIDIPLFFEANAKDKNAYPIDKILLIYSPRELQIARITKRDNLKIDEAQMRIQAQMDIELKRKMATFIIENTKDLPFLQSQIESFLKNITE
ncbi:dephospho-CoA kinase [Helicobacter sp. 16-1353]|uniref:dephospho-CoA kinase n=1 Tax=Helicobacter sp. 16-1353 TaxID=2004996 RepID=UPI000DCE108C|nr:dephospho-CoA kinase [Helicobacter sp. 16-1353]RAX51488.1 dephospho-CoA kinase [Helicobacter sp. 16-1353]